MSRIFLRSFPRSIDAVYQTDRGIKNRRIIDFNYPNMRGIRIKMKLYRKFSGLFGYDVERFKKQINLERNLSVLFMNYDLDLVIDVGANKGQYVPHTSWSRLQDGEVISGSLWIPDR